MDIKTITPLYTTALFIIWFLVLFSIEFFIPLRNKNYSLINRVLINILLSAFSFLIVWFVVTPAAKNAMGFATAENFGILYITNFSPVVEGVIAFMLMDLLFYYWHLANHKIPVLWRFHNVHHIDPDLDVTTSFRFHFGEIALSAFFRIIQVLLIGITPAVYIIYEICFTLNTMFQHSNIKLPYGFERILNKIIVTPRMHAIHHSQNKNETDSNYSTVFSWWDRLHKSIRLNVSHKDIIIGVPAYSNSNDNRLGNLLLLPFKRQKNYWMKPSGSIQLEREKYMSDTPGKLVD